MAYRSGRRNGSTKADLERRAKLIVEKGGIDGPKNGRYGVRSQSKKDLYCDVAFQNIWRCACAYFASGRETCKHIPAVCLLAMGAGWLVPAGFLISGPEMRCKRCGSANCVFPEARRRKRGASMRYRCRGCGCRSACRPGFHWRHYGEAAITWALEDRAAGKSLAAAARAVPRHSHSGVKSVPSRSTILRWEEYAGKAGLKAVMSMPVRAGGRWAVDEIFYKVCSIGRYMFGVMDTESRFMLAAGICLSDNKLAYDLTAMFERVIKTAGRIPQVLIGDCLNGFALAFKNTMLKRCKRGERKPIHILSAAVQRIHLNNNRYGRQNGTVRDRIKTVRGFNSEHPPLLRLFIMHYNFIRQHEGLDKRTPAEAMGIRIAGNDKWKTLLAFAFAC